MHYRIFLYKSRLDNQLVPRPEHLVWELFHVIIDPVNNLLVPEKKLR